MTDSPTVFVLVGATGDLARRMVLPAFFQLAQHGLLPAQWLHQPLLASRSLQQVSAPMHQQSQAPSASHQRLPALHALFDLRGQFGHRREGFQAADLLAADDARAATAVPEAALHGRQLWTATPA